VRLKRTSSPSPKAIEMVIVRKARRDENMTPPSSRLEIGRVAVGVPRTAPTDPGVRVKDAPGSSRCGIAVPHTIRSFRGGTLARYSVLGVVPTPRFGGHHT
jgi:hypothetical protein